MTTPYRNDLDALRAELAELELELSRARQSRQALAGAAAREEALGERVERLRKRVREGARRALPFLNNMRVATPCSADWDTMTGDDRVRFCGSCQKDVFDLSGMTGDQAEAFVRERSALPEGTCVRFFRRTDGTVLTADCPTGVARRRRQKIAGVAVGASLVAAGAAAFAMGTRTTGSLERMPPVSKVELQPDQPMMGEMVMGGLHSAEPETTAQPKPPTPPKQTPPRPKSPAPPPKRAL